MHFLLFSRNSVSKFKGQDYSDTEVPKILKAGFLLKGSARFRGENIRHERNCYKRGTFKSQ